MNKLGLKQTLLLQLKPRHCVQDGLAADHPRATKPTTWFLEVRSFSSAPMSSPRFDHSGSYRQMLVTEGIRRRLELVIDDLDSVSELYSSQHLWQLVGTIEPTPAFLGPLDQLEHHRKRSLVREAAFRTDRPVPHGCKRTFYRVRCSQVLPVFGGEIIECE